MNCSGSVNAIAYLIVLIIVSYGQKNRTKLDFPGLFHSVIDFFKVRFPLKVAVNYFIFRPFTEFRYKINVKSIIKINAP